MIMPIINIVMQIKQMKTLKEKTLLINV